MLLVHARPMAALVLGDEAFSPLRTLFLVLSALFFALKVVDVPWLRFRTDLRASITWLLILGILHMGALNRTLNPAGSAPNNEIAIVLISTVTSISAFGAVRLVQRVIAAMQPKFRPLTTLISLVANGWCAKFRTMCLISRTVPRAPPF